MKVLSIIALVIAIVGLIIGAYCQIEVVPNYNILDGRLDLTDLERSVWHSYHDEKFLLGSIALLLGGVSMIGGLIAGIKKRKIGWIAVGIGLISLLLGAAQSTHMFS